MHVNENNCCFNMRLVGSTGPPVVVKDQHGQVQPRRAHLSNTTS
jgi:hypothetical protein